MHTETGQGQFSERPDCNAMQCDPHPQLRSAGTRRELISLKAINNGKLQMLKYTMITLAMFMCFGSGTAKAEVPVLKSGTSVIYLADNLDEKD